MGNNLARQLIADHLVEAGLRPGEEIALKIGDPGAAGGPSIVAAAPVHAPATSPIAFHRKPDYLVANSW